MESESDNHHTTDAVRESNWTAACQRLGLQRGGSAGR
jgi:hypothetical protein